MVHLVYCDDKDKVLGKITSGSKTMVVRGAVGRKILHSRVFENELLYFMEKGSKKITAMAIVSDVQNYVKLTPEETGKVLEDNQKRLQLSDKQKVRWSKKCLCLVGFKDVKGIEVMDFDHQGNMDDWLVLEKLKMLLWALAFPLTMTMQGLSEYMYIK